MTLLFLGFLLAGLVLAVYSMLYGTERHPSDAALPAPHERISEHVPAAEPSALLNAASVSAFAVGFGLVGYIVSRFSDWNITGCVSAAAVAGALLMTVQSLLIARWAIPAARAEHVDERYLLQGTIGKLTRAVPFGGAGEMQYTLDGRTYALPARSMDNDPMDINAEVVVDRVEQGVAFVELWSRVEQRL